jgi:hypothetical protein
MYLERIDEDNSRVGPCCNSGHRPVPNSELNFHTNPFLNQLRQENLAGQPSEACASCYRQERYTGNSLRISSINYYDDVDPNNDDLWSLDFNVDPICNAKCIICHHNLSSAILAEEIRFGLKKDMIIRTASSSRASRVIEDIDLSRLRRIYFNGGEPMLSDDPVRLLTKLRDMGRIDQVEMGFHSNGSTRPRPELIELMRQCRRLMVFFSIDGVGEQFEYIRNGLHWQSVLDTVDFVIGQDLPNLDLASSCSIGMHNVEYVESWHQWWWSYTTECIQRYRPTNLPRVFNTAQLVAGPLDLHHTSQSLKQHWLRLYEANYQDRVWASMVMGACRSPASGEEDEMVWLRHFQRLDQRRGNDWRQALPKLYESCKLVGIDV